MFGASSTPSTPTSPAITLRRTECFDGSVVVTTYLRGLYESMAYLPGGGTSEARQTLDNTRAMMNHDGLAYRHGGRR